MRREYEKATNCDEEEAFPVVDGEVVSKECSQIPIMETLFYDPVERTAPVDVVVQNGKVVCRQNCSKKNNLNKLRISTVFIVKI